MKEKNRKVVDYSLEFLNAESGSSLMLGLIEEVMYILLT